MNGWFSYPSPDITSDASLITVPSSILSPAPGLMLIWKAMFLVLAETAGLFSYSSKVRRTVAMESPSMLLTPTTIAVPCATFLSLYPTGVRHVAAPRCILMTTIARSQ